ncbi:MAG: peptidase U32 family protein [Halodesulfurarchaeum sp.]
MLNIFTPIKSLEGAEELIQLGADELYCGVNPEEWAERYENVKTPNRRPNDHSQVEDLEELAEIATLCHETDVKLYLTLNDHFYSDDQATLLRELVEELSTWEGITGYIVADVHFMTELRNVVGDDEILVSTGATTFNGHTAAFLESLGADGIHLPRHLTLDEIETIARTAPDSLDLYAFALNSNCLLIDGHCTLLHNAPIEHEESFKEPCMQTYTQRLADGGEERTIRDETRLFNDPHRTEQACGVCSLYRFDQIGLSGVKMVGRRFPVSRKKADLEVLDHARRKTSEADTEAEFRDMLQETVTDRGMECSIDACYYPTVMDR